MVSVRSFGGKLRRDRAGTGAMALNYGRDTAGIVDLALVNRQLQSHDLGVQPYRSLEHRLFTIT